MTQSEFDKRMVKKAKSEHKLSLSNPKKYNLGQQKIVDAIFNSEVPNFNLKISSL